MEGPAAAVWHRRASRYLPGSFDGGGGMIGFNRRRGGWFKQGKGWPHLLHTGRLRTWPAETMPDFFNVDRLMLRCPFLVLGLQPRLLERGDPLL